MASAGAIMTRQHYTDLFASRLAFLDEILFENFNAPVLTYPLVFNVRDSSRAYEEITGISGFDQFDVKNEGEPITYDRLLQLYDKRFTHKTYAKGYQITFEAMDDDIDGAISNAAPALSRIANNSIETELFSDFNGAFDTTTTPDGKYLASGTHVLVGGGQFDNLVSGDLAQGTLEEAINTFDDMRDERNQHIEMSGDRILFPNQLRWVVHELLKSQLQPGSANNAVNTLNQLGLQTVQCKYLTGADDWFVLSSPDQHRVIVYWRMEPVTDHNLDFETGNMKTKMTYRLSHGAADWRGIVCGQGA